MFSFVYSASCDDRTRQVIAIGMCSVSASEDQVLETLTWMLDNGLNQHLESAVESASKGVLGDSAAIPWFMDHFKDVSKRDNILTWLISLHEDREQRLSLHHETVGDNSFEGVRGELKAEISSSAL